MRTSFGSYADAGCTIAVDDVGCRFSNLDRIALIQPKIMKIDLNILKKASVHDGYKSLLRSFSTISAQIGASLLVEGIETRADLQHALEIGARYGQGYLFGRAERELQSIDQYKPLLLQEIDLFHDKSYEKFEILTHEEQSWNAMLENIMDNLGQQDDADVWLIQLLPLLPAACIRIYACMDDRIRYRPIIFLTRRGAGTWIPAIGARTGAGVLISSPIY